MAQRASDALAGMERDHTRHTVLGRGALCVRARAGLQELAQGDALAPAPVLPLCLPGRGREQVSVKNNHSDSKHLSKKTRVFFILTGYLMLPYLARSNPTDFRKIP